MTNHLQYALEQDRLDPLAGFRERFYLPENGIYLDGNSLGLAGVDAEASVLRVLEEWKKLGIRGWLEAQRPWFWFAEQLGEMASPLVGAAAGELVATGTTTVNIHALISSFYQPEPGRDKILADLMNFPSDLYALQGQLRLRELDPEQKLVLVAPENERLLNEDRIISLMTEDVALVFLPSVVYSTGQLLDMERLTQEAHRRGILIGFDCSHSAGSVPHALHEWGVDFATFCSYKYLNGGPGVSAFLYVHSKHFDREPRLSGWFGYVKEKQFDMLPDFEHCRSAGGWQISSPGILGSATLEGSLQVLREAGMVRIREKSLKLTSWLAELIQSQLSNPEYEFSIVTPLDEKRRGGHISLRHPTEAWRITEALRARHIIPDFRAPDMIRIAPVALYNRFEEVWQLVEALRDIMEKKEYLAFAPSRREIS